VLISAYIWFCGRTTLRPCWFNDKRTHSKSQSLADRPPTKTTCCERQVKEVRQLSIFFPNDCKPEGALTETLFWAVRHCSSTAWVIQSMDGLKNFSTSVLRSWTTLWATRQTDSGKTRYSPSNFQLPEPNVTMPIIVSSGSKFDVLRFSGISESGFRCFIKATDYVIQIVHIIWLRQRVWSCTWLARSGCSKATRQTLQKILRIEVDVHRSMKIT